MPSRQRKRPSTRLGPQAPAAEAALQVLPNADLPLCAEIGSKDRAPAALRRPSAQICEGHDGPLKALQFLCESCVSKILAAAGDYDEETAFLIATGHRA